MICSSSPVGASVSHCCTRALRHAAEYLLTSAVYAEELRPQKVPSGLAGDEPLRISARLSLPEDGAGDDERCVAEIEDGVALDGQYDARRQRPRALLMRRASTVASKPRFRTDPTFWIWVETTAGCGTVP